MFRIVHLHDTYYDLIAYKEMATRTYIISKILFSFDYGLVFTDDGIEAEDRIKYRSVLEVYGTKQQKNIS